MLVKCKGCNKKIDRDLAYNNRINNINNYYCNEKEFININFEKECRIKVYEVIDNIFGYKVFNNILRKDITEICKHHTHASIYEFLYEKRDKIADILNSKDFTSEYSKIKYFCAIIKNKIGDYKKNKPVRYKDDIELDNVKVSFSNSHKKKKCLDEYVEDYYE